MRLLKEKIPAVNFWQIWIFSTSSILYAKCQQFLGVKIIVKNGKFSFTELTYSDLKQATFFWASLPCSRSILASYLGVVMSLSITLSILVNCHRVNNSNYNLILLSIMIKMTLLRKTLVCTVQKVSHAFVQSLREILNRKKQWKNTQILNIDV